MGDTTRENFQAQVHAALNNQAEEEKIYETLKEIPQVQFSSSKVGCFSVWINYHPVNIVNFTTPEIANYVSLLSTTCSTNDVQKLVKSLRFSLADPNRLHLFEAVRPFVAVHHQIKYDRICPTVPGKKLKTIRLMRKGIEDLGFTFRGGLDYGTRAFVSRVDSKSLAEIHGLMPGDEIVRINGFDLSQALHSEILLLLKIRNQTLELKVRRMGLMPVREFEGDKLIWTFVEGNKSEADEQMERVSSIMQGVADEKDRKVHVSLEPGAKLGCGIGSNEEWGLGIFVCRVNKGSVSDTLGFQVGDQVIEVNGVSYIDIGHEEAVMNLKTSRHLTVILRSRETTTSAEVNPPPPSPKEPEPLYASVTKKNKEDSGANWSFEKKEDDWWLADPETLFNPIQIDGRELKKVEIVKDGPLNMFLEGGNKTPLGGKIVVSDIYPDGAIDRSGQITKGDQIMMCEGVKLVDVPLEEAEKVFKKHMTGDLDGSEKLRIIIAVTPPRDYEDEM
ncbi:putative harmonin-like [Apostichopus japonicus]|uniref:Putative harmonin-like n=1 Tax=Stichopus japonicus TaxID=307972 RepID=A0A2G8K1F2_STIJA|nr:putative harmonin-like [Apostichopus japonicus]